MNLLSKLKWLYPGMKIKRWLCILPFGLLFVIIGTVFLVNEYFHNILIILGRFSFQTIGINVSDPMQLIPFGCLFVLIGFFIIYYVIKKVLESVVYTVTGNKENLADQVFKKRMLTSGPMIVVIGGGTGLSTMLRGLKEYTSNITAIVTVSDDGGSSGRLRNEMGILPPGDIRNCLVALADTEESMKNLLQYRFDNINEGMTGHSFGNLMLGALTDITGDFESAVSKLSDILAIRGKVYPCSKTPIELVAEFEDGTEETGETEIVSISKNIIDMKLSNPDAKPPQVAVDAIIKADFIILGPGSLFTSVIPNLLIKDIKNAVIKSKAKKIYVCNVMTQPGETDRFDAADHFITLKKYLNNEKIDYCMVNNVKPDDKILDFYKSNGQDFVEYTKNRFKGTDTKIIAGDYMQSGDRVRHDFRKLSYDIIKRICYDRNRD